MLAAFHAGGSTFIDWPELTPGLVVTPAGLRPDPGPAVELVPANGRLVAATGRPPRLRLPRAARAQSSGPPRPRAPRPTAADRAEDVPLHPDVLRRAPDGSMLVRERTARGIRVRWV
jgi:hypothetical protein